MKPEVSEQILIEELFKKSVENKKVECGNLTSIERLTGDASTRKYYRVFCSEQSYVVCLDNPTEVNKNPFVQIQGFLYEKGIRVPNIYDRNVEKGYLLEEDLGDETLLKVLGIIKDPAQELQVYKTIIDQLVKMHSLTKDELSGTLIETQAFDYDKYAFEIDFSLKYFLRKFLNVDDESIYLELKRSFDDICKELSSYPMVCTHRDFHSRNVMVKNGENIIIDFQDARMGIPQYDLVSLLEDCYYELLNENKKELIDYYFNQMDMTGLGQGSKDHFKEVYDLMTLQRVFKAIGSFSYIFEHRKDYRYVKYIGFAMEKIRTVMLKYDRFTPLRRSLFDIYYES
tara:strand:- start:121878 stop:122903 length:1026 start_codon:yes stop_codon:yes gene_type:complete